MDATGGIHKRTGLPEPADQLLHRFDIPVLADGADQLHTVVPVGADLPAPLLPLAVQTAVAHDLPFAAGGIPCEIGVIEAALIFFCGAEIFGNDLGSAASGKPGHFNFNSEILTLYLHLLTSFTTSCAAGSGLFPETAPPALQRN
ncbi:hypothetical protein SDC9_185916 [bioreactor metagenome]|uniref:Uncharacterized protein n=1 Tax=bioreactor metagenome TaxID=1076179 RepID=A0A645HJ09_9ZZZZ